MKIKIRVSHTKRNHQNYLAKITIVNFAMKFIPRLSLLLCNDSSNFTKKTLLLLVDQVI